MEGMRIELLVVPECAYESAAVEVLTTALADVGLGSVGFTVTVVDSQEDADRRHFIGSPVLGELRLNPTLGIATWYRDHLDHQLPILLGQTDPFAGCTPDKHQPAPTLPVVPAPAGYWPEDAG